MKKLNSFRQKFMVIAQCTMGLLLMFTLSIAEAGKITKLSWDTDKLNTLQVYVDGKAKYKIHSLEDGKRLRVTFRKSELGSGIQELGGRSDIKGVFPYLADGGATVNVDVLMVSRSHLEVKKAPFGYVVTAIIDEPEIASQEAAQAPESKLDNEIEDISYTTLPGGRVQLRLKMAKTPSAPKAFTISNPARIALDFANTGLKVEKTSLKIGVGALVSVKAIQSDDRTRVVLNLIRPVGYKTSVTDNTLVFTLNSPTTAISSAIDRKTTGFQKGGAGQYSLNNIDFRRDERGGAKLIITLSDPSVGIDIKDEAGDIILDFLDTALPRELERRLDVVDFATPVQTVDIFRQGKNTRIVIVPTGKYEHLAYQAGNVFTLNVKPVTEKEDEKQKDEFGYSGEKLSLNFQNIEARAALQVLADFTGLNFVMSDTVRGELTLRLKDVPWDQALDLILDAKGLAMRRRGNVITVAPADEVAAKEKAAFESAKVAVELEPLVSELIQINYASADDIAKLLKSIKAITTGAAEHPVFGNSISVTKESTESNSLLSPRGQVTTDSRTNSILIQDTPGKIKELRKLIAKLDQPVRQVLIESRLVEATDNFSRQLGAKFGVQGTNVGTSQTISQGGNLNTDGTVSTANGLNVNLPTAGIGKSLPGTLALTLAKLGTGSLLSLELSALEQEGKGKIISSPRIVTANGQTAKIEQGQERVFTTSVLGVGTVITKKAVLKLEVEPRITPDDRIIMDVKITKDNFADALQGILNIKKINTQVLLDNGETVVIGGIYELDKSRTNTKVPFFGDLPLLGYMFKNKVTVESKTELLIFLTPRILNELSSAR